MRLFIYFIVNLIYFLNSNAQSTYYIDTFSSIHSKYDYNSGMDISFDSYYLSYEDFRKINNPDNRKDSILKKYSPIRNFLVPLNRDGERTTSFSIEKVICKDTFSFIVPLSRYNISIDTLLMYGLEISSQIKKDTRYFGSLNATIVNFYKNHQAFHSLSSDTQSISGKEFQSVYEKIKFDKIEIIVINQLDDVFSMTFFLKSG